MGNNNQAALNPSEIQRGQREARSEELRLRSLLEFVEAVLEAGLKKFDAMALEPDEPNWELTPQRNYSFAELDCAQSRLPELDVSVHHRVGRANTEIVPNNPGATYDEIVRHVIDTVLSRMKDQLTHLEEDVLRNEDNGYYLQEEIAPGWGWL